MTSAGELLQLFLRNFHGFLSHLFKELVHTAHVRTRNTSMHHIGIIHSLYVHNVVENREMLPNRARLVGQHT